MCEKDHSISRHKRTALWANSARAPINSSHKIKGADTCSVLWLGPNREMDHDLWAAIYSQEWNWIGLIYRDQYINSMFSLITLGGR